MSETQTVEVDVKSAWTSKINWAQAVAAGAMVLTLLTSGKFNISPEEQVAIVATIGVVSNAVTWILKTWFTPTVTVASIKK